MAAVCWIHLLHTERDVWYCDGRCNSIGIGIRISSPGRQHVIVIPHGTLYKEHNHKNIVTIL
jgi:hypothetical protein